MKNTQVARTAGALYLLTIVAGIFGEIPSTIENATAHEPIFRLAIASNLVCLASYVAVTVLLYEIFKTVHRRLSLVAAAFSVVGIAVLAASVVGQLAVLRLIGHDEAAHFALRLHGEGYLMADVFFGIYCLLIGTLIARSQLMPRFIGALMMLAGVGYLLDSFSTIVAPAFAASIGDYSLLPGLIGEGVLTMWLLIMGVTEPSGRVNA